MPHIAGQVSKLKTVTNRRIAKPRAKEKSSAYRVFISHSSHDSWIAKMMAQKIRDVGAEIWLDEKDLEGGDFIIGEIIKGIEASQEAIVLISPASIKSQWVALEIGAVLSQHKRITPILIHTNYDAMAPLKDIQAKDINKFDQFLIELMRRIARYRHRAKRKE
ncbi:MAG: toll/interleukin-1 receptor domain-containing protein [Chloroflexi bacterium]|nr:toll/interleukin-1 receptor domain-containing protein [Chloroflexota bacterium]